MRKLIFILMLLLVAACFAQSDPIDYLNKAKKWAEVQLYDQALDVISDGLVKYPQDHDLQAYEIRILLWQKNFNQVNTKIEDLLNTDPDDYELLQLKITSLWWSSDWKKLLEVSQSSLNRYHNDPFFMEKKLIALVELKQYREAKRFVSQIEESTSLLKKLALESKLNHHQRVGINFIYSHFDNTFSPWKVTRASYHRESKNAWSAGANYGSMFDKNGISLDGTLYPTLGKSLRGVFDIGGSNSEIFAQYRMGAELIADVKKIELSAGGRMLKFKSEEAGVFIYTAGAGVYCGSFYINYKAYLAQFAESNTIDLTHTFFVRRFLGNRFHYVQLNGSRGSTPLQVNNFSEISRLEATSVRLSYHILLKKKLLFNTSIGVQEERYVSGNRNRVDGAVGLSMILN